MAPMPRTWNDPSPYSYVPKPLFRFKQQHSQQQLSPDADAADEAALAEVKAEWYVPSNPHNLPAYPYFESTAKADPARSRAARDGKWDNPIRPGAAPIWHPPPPPHDDIYRINRSPNLHDGSDLKTSFVMPPCCDFCMSTYFPHIINDELQLPKLEPYTMAKVPKQSLIETDSDEEEDESEDASLLELAGSGGKEKPKPLKSAEAFANALPSAKSDPAKCCHKCIRKDIEDTAWHVYALPAKKRRHHRR